MLPCAHCFSKDIFSRTKTRGFRSLIPIEKTKLDSESQTTALKTSILACKSIRSSQILGTDSTVQSNVLECTVVF